MTLIDFIIHGGQTQSDGKFADVAIQAVTESARNWLAQVSLTLGKFVGEVLVLQRLEDVEALFAALPEHYSVI